MDLLIVLLLVLLLLAILSSARKRENLEKHHKENNASFVAEVEEYARWSEIVFKAYCNLAGTSTALSELQNAKPAVELYEYDDGFAMPKIVVDRRGHLGTRFREVFENLKDPIAIEKLKLHYQLPLDQQIRFDDATRKHLRIGGEISVREDYYKSLYQIVYLNVYLTLLARKYNIGKNGIKASEIDEYQQIQKTLIHHPWLEGKFKRY